MVYPPLVKMPPTNLEEMVAVMEPSRRLRIEVKGENMNGKEYTKTLMLKVGDEATGKDRLAGIGFETREEDGKIYQRPFGGHTTEYGEGPPVQRTCAAADRTGHAILHTLYGQSLKNNAEFFDSMRRG